MSDRMTPIPFPALIRGIFEEFKKYGSVFGVKKLCKADPETLYPVFGGLSEAPIGPAAGPHTQLAQNIIAAYCAGARFFELKTVQKLDGDDLSVDKPCILAEDEGYNVEWSTELTVPQAFDEYVKAYFAIKVLSKELSLGSPDGFVFNMSVGYDLEGVKAPKLDAFIEGLKNAESTAIFAECKNYLLENAAEFKNVTTADINAISPRVCNSVTLSTLHGCPPDEIERISEYLLSVKHLNTLIKCNPTLLGYDLARKTLDALGYGYLSFGRFHFEDDLQYADAVPLISRLSALAASLGLSFGVKLTNTFPVDITQHELPGNEMYMSGKPLSALSLALAEKLSGEFGEKLPISYSGGADAHNIENILLTGIRPVTLATTLLKSGGYSRLKQIAESCPSPDALPVGVSAEKVAELSRSLKDDDFIRKPVKPLPLRKINREVPLVDCFISPCSLGCPINQDIPQYVKLVGAGEYAAAIRLIAEKNPMPNTTGTICAHPCMTKCTRNFYETPVNIRGTKLKAVEHAFDVLLAETKPAEITRSENVAIVGGGPAGISAAYFLLKNGVKATIFEKTSALGGVPMNVIPDFRVGREAVRRDAELVQRLGARVVLGREITDLNELFEQGFTHIVLAVGAEKRGGVAIEDAQTLNALDFLARFKEMGADAGVGEYICVIGGGNTAMDAARAALRTKNAKKVFLIYRRTRRYMPADEEELSEALEDGVEFKELLAPAVYDPGALICRKMALGEPDASGRPGVVETAMWERIPCDTIIAAAGEQIDPTIFINNSIELDKRGRPLIKDERIFAAGDCLNGPRTVVEALRDGKKAAEAILGHSAAPDAETPARDGSQTAKKGVLVFEKQPPCEAERCLECGALCESCADVCPNRANVSISVPGMAMPQIIHLDARCNECGNCMAFCPYLSAPFRDKLTLFKNENDFFNSENNGFFVEDAELPVYTLRINGVVEQYCGREGHFAFDAALREIILSVIFDHSYLL